MNFGYKALIECFEFKRHQLNYFPVCDTKFTIKTCHYYWFSSYFFYAYCHEM